MVRQRWSEEITAPIWEGYPEPARRRADDTSTGMRPRPLAAVMEAEPSPLPGWLDAALRDPAVVLVGAAVLGLMASGLAGAIGFLLGLLVA